MEIGDLGSGQEEEAYSKFSQADEIVRLLVTWQIKKYNCYLRNIQISSDGANLYISSLKKERLLGPWKKTNVLLEWQLITSSFVISCHCRDWGKSQKEREWHFLGCRLLPHKGRPSGGLLVLPWLMAISWWVAINWNTSL